MVGACTCPEGSELYCASCISSSNFSVRKKIVEYILYVAERSVLPIDVYKALSNIADDIYNQKDIGDGIPHDWLD